MENKTLEKTCDIVVVGAGHAGCEAALAGARLGLDTVMFTVSVDSIALMPCNPNVGGSSKGHQLYFHSMSYHHPLPEPADSSDFCPVLFLFPEAPDKLLL